MARVVPSLGVFVFVWACVKQRQIKIAFVYLKGLNRSLANKKQV